MVQTHNLGFPRIGAQRELKFALEKHWKGIISEKELQQTGAELREKHWQDQQQLDLIPVGDFSFYDQVLDLSFLVGNVPKRIQTQHKSTDGELSAYFRLARGRSAQDGSCACTQAGEMTKWFDSNYHYIVPEFTAETQFELHSQQLLKQIKQAQALGHKVKPVLIGPLSYLYLGKSKDQTNKLDLLPKLLPIYQQLFQELAEHNIEWLQIDEPILVTELESNWQQALLSSYQSFANSPIKLLLTTYFGQLKENLTLLTQVPVAGYHLDAINAPHEVETIIEQLSAQQVLSLGVINGRNIWKTDLNKTLDWLEPIAQQLQERLWLAPSCSLLHVPVDLDKETQLDPELHSWLAFAKQKLTELNVLAEALNKGRESVAQALEQNQAALLSKQQSTKVHKPEVQQAVANITPQLAQRNSPYEQRAQIQQEKLNLPLFPTTTIGSFPQTSDIRGARLQFKQGKIKADAYQELMQQQIQTCIQKQEELELDVFVHGEPERNDMVEYFGEQLEGYAFSQQAWVQSYGSRCVKPPILFGDISRPKAMTVEWINYAQSLSNKPVKGMLTGPVTILNWSFVRDDQERSLTCQQLALAIRQEVQDLEQAGVEIIQIDEAALREGLPLRKSEWNHYLSWAIEAFKISANGVQDSTQIHTHMCYSDFNEIIAAIANMDADVITIECSRSDMKLLDAFDDFNYPNEIGPGVYDIHSPNIPNTEHMVNLMQEAAKRIPAERLWINPDCGLKTRQWDEVIPALKNMVTAAKILRNEVKTNTTNTKQELAEALA